MQTVPFIDLGMVNSPLKQKVLERISRIIDNSSFIGGSDVEKFEQKFAEFCGTRHAIGVANGTDAILLALLSRNIGPGDEVITPANTFVATLEGIVHCGATPVLVDIDPSTQNIDVSKIESSITPRTKVIIPVHLFGQTADMAAVMELAGKYNLDVVEDAAQAHGATFDGKRVGSFGNVATFSFYPAKNLGAFGDAGAVVTDDDAVADKVRALQDHGSIAKYEHEYLGFNSRLDPIQAAVIELKLDLIDEWNRDRQRLAQTYDELLVDFLPVETPDVGKLSTHIYHLYVVRVDELIRDGVIAGLNERGVSTGIHYPYPVHLSKAFGSLGYGEGSFPVAEKYANQMISLPMYPGLSTDQVQYVVDQLKASINAKGGAL